MNKELTSIFLTVFLLAFGMSFAAPLVPLLLKSIGSSTAEIGQIQTTYFVFFTLFTLLLGTWIDRAGSKKMILAGLLLFGLSLFVMPFASCPFYFYLIRSVQGIGSALLFAPTESAINIVSPPEKRATNMGIYGLVFGCGFALGPVLGTTLYSVSTGAPFMIAGCFCFAACIILYAFFHEHPVPVKKTDWHFISLVIRLKVPLTAAACYAVVEITIASFFSLYLDSLGIAGSSLGFVFTLFAVGGIVSPFPSGYIADRLGKAQVLKACGVLLVVTVLAFNFYKTYTAICVLIFCVGLVAGALYPVSLSLIGELVPPQTMGSANASFSFFYGLGSIAGPLLTGWILEATSIAYLFYPITAAAVLFMLVTWLNNEGLSIMR